MIQPKTIATGSVTEEVAACYLHVAICRFESCVVNAFRIDLCPVLSTEKL